MRLSCRVQLSPQRFHVATDDLVMVEIKFDPDRYRWKVDYFFFPRDPRGSDSLGAFRPNLGEQRIVGSSDLVDCLKDETPKRFVVLRQAKQARCQASLREIALHYC